jgi:hypothetical protein
VSTAAVAVGEFLAAAAAAAAASTTASSSSAAAMASCARHSSCKHKQGLVGESAGLEGDSAGCVARCGLIQRDTAAADVLVSCQSRRILMAQVRSSSSSMIAKPGESGELRAPCQ